MRTLKHPLPEQTDGIGVVTGALHKHRNRLNMQGSTRNGTLGYRDRARAINGRLPDTEHSEHWMPPVRKRTSRTTPTVEQIGTALTYKVRADRAPRHSLTRVASFLINRGWDTESITHVLNIYRDRPTDGTYVEVVMGDTWQKH